MRYVMLGLALLAAACAVSPRPSTLMVPLGFTECRTRPDSTAVAVSWLRLDVAMRDPQRLVVAAHEAEHARQIEMFRTCGEYSAWRRENADRSEAMAMCASALAANRFAEMQLDTAIALYARILSESYPELQLDIATARQMIGAHCGR